jgi:hypothetical protein
MTMIALGCLRRFLAALLCLLMLPIPAALAQKQPATSQPAGEISALIPAATRNHQRAKAKGSLAWNDLLDTDQSGRLRAALLDGSILSMGRESHLVVVQHDAATQQTALELNYGRVRSRVVAITRAGGKFEIRTPLAVAGVIGTDFYVFATADLTRVICYSGQVIVTLTAAAAGEPAATSGPASITLTTGQMVEVRRGQPLGSPQTVTAEMQQESILETAVPETAATNASGRSFLSRHGPWIAAVAAAAAAGIVIGTTGGKTQTSSSSCSSNCGHTE